MDRLDAAAIGVPGVEVRVVERCGSTNDLALKADSAILVAAEEQTAGRGRRGRRWHGGGITFSLGRRIERPVRELAALSLVAGVAAARALRALGVDVALKWPNDLVTAGGKLGGILVETRNGNYAVIGIGINYRRAPDLQAKVRQPTAFLGLDVPRNEVIRRIAVALLEAIGEFERRGLDGLRAEWQAMHAHAGQRVRVRLADGRVMSGTARGLAEDGSLQVMTRKGMQAVRSGRVVSARAA
jgi:BirA family transcriptional regulator, biotin operon repressor / biotin---[acetyl-CoA-carboxylase] ligase